MVKRLNFTFKTTITQKALNRKKESLIWIFRKIIPATVQRLGQREWGTQATVIQAGLERPKKAHTSGQEKGENRLNRNKNYLSVTINHDMTNEI